MIHSLENRPQKDFTQGRRSILTKYQSHISISQHCLVSGSIFENDLWNKRTFVKITWLKLWVSKSHLRNQGSSGRRRLRRHGSFKSSILSLKWSQTFFLSTTASVFSEQTSGIQCRNLRMETRNLEFKNGEDVDVLHRPDRDHQNKSTKVILIHGFFIFSADYIQWCKKILCNVFGWTESFIDVSIFWWDVVFHSDFIARWHIGRSWNRCNCLSSWCPVNRSVGWWWCSCHVISQCICSYPAVPELVCCLLIGSLIGWRIWTLIGCWGRI